MFLGIIPLFDYQKILVLRVLGYTIIGIGCDLNVIIKPSWVSITNDKQIIRRTNL